MEHAAVVILGMGTCGEDLGLRLTSAGLDVVGVEAGLLGGECAYWACLPSKVMIRAADLLQEAPRVDGVAGHAEVAPDWTPVAERIRAEVSGDDLRLSHVPRGLGEAFGAYAQGVQQVLDAGADGSLFP